MSEPVRVTVIDDTGHVTFFVPEGSVPPPPPPPDGEEPPDPVAPPDPPTSPGSGFQVFQTWSGHPPVTPGGTVLWSINFSRTPLADPPIAPANLPFGFVPGRSRWNDKKDNPLGAHGADRVAYRLAYWFLQHTDRVSDADTIHHDYLDIVRFHVQSYGGQNNQINDQYMIENPFGGPGESQGEAQYPYEPGRKPMVLDKSSPGATFLARHRRKVGTSPPRSQLLRQIVIPATDPHNSHTKWWYQDAGRVVATNDNFIRPDNPDGCIALLIVTAHHPAYTIVEDRF